MAAVLLDNSWVDVNFKESQLRKIRIGQSVEVVSDFHGSKVAYHGKVMGLSAGTGSVFSLLPAQNATGNWIKVIQRAPVRISLDPRELHANPLRMGLSTTVKVNISESTGEGMALTAGRGMVLPETDKVGWAMTDTLVEKIFEKCSK